MRFHGDVPERLKELAIITAAREANNDYVWTAHERLARQQGVTDPIINAIRNRTAPDGLSGDDAKVVRFAKELLTTHELLTPRLTPCTDAGQQGHHGLDSAHPVLPLPGPRPASRQAGNAAGHPVNAVRQRAVKLLQRRWWSCQAIQRPRNT